MDTAQLSAAAVARGQARRICRDTRQAEHRGLSRVGTHGNELSYLQRQTLPKLLPAQPGRGSSGVAALVSAQVQGTTELEAPHLTSELQGKAE